MVERAQRTLKTEVRFSGLGIHLGKAATFSLLPSGEDSGIVFKKFDSVSGRETEIPADLVRVSSTGRCTTLSNGQESICTVEHLLAALKAYRIDNAVIRIEGEEIPAGDGSSAVFINLIEQAGIIEQNKPVRTFRLMKTVCFKKDEIFLAAVPSQEFRISYTLHYPKIKMIGTQHYSCKIEPEFFKKEISGCRTFALYNELRFLMDRGLIKGGSLENAIVFNEKVAISNESLRFPDEPVRHKILDLIGDLSLVGKNFLAHIIAIGSGHSSNVALGKKIANMLY
ncbi:MAG: UDP-3-O-acyl-N-acetylglucosamine deacetylase [Victivallaceae bacterium]